MYNKIFIFSLLCFSISITATAQVSKFDPERFSVEACFQAINVIIDSEREVFLCSTNPHHYPNGPLLACYGMPYYDFERFEYDTIAACTGSQYFAKTLSKNTSCQQSLNEYNRLMKITMAQTKLIDNKYNVSSYDIIQQFRAAYGQMYQCVHSLTLPEITSGQINELQNKLLKNADLMASLQKLNDLLIRQVRTQKLMIAALKKKKTGRR